MSKRSLIVLAVLAVALGIAVPFWAISTAGSKSGSPLEVDEQDEVAQELFAVNCGACHILQRAGTHGVVGPNLDERFRAPTEEAREGNVPFVLGFIEDGSGGVMPAGILQGEQAETVAEFVAKVAGD